MKLTFFKKLLPSAVAKCKTVSGNDLFWLNNMLKLENTVGGFLDIAAAVT